MSIHRWAEFVYDDEHRRLAIAGVPVTPRLVRIRRECPSCGGLHEQPTHECESCTSELGGRE